MGRTALEQSLSRELNRSLSVFTVQMNTPEPYSHSRVTGSDSGFAPRRVRIRTRLGREGERDLDLFFKIPHEREIESYILGRRLGLRNLPKLVTTAVELLSPTGEPLQAMTYFHHPGQCLAAVDLTTADWSLPDELIEDIARLHASTSSSAGSYVVRGYPEKTPEYFRERLEKLDIELLFGMEFFKDRRGETEALLGRAIANLPEAVERAFACGPTVTHGDLNPYNIIIGEAPEAGDGGRSLLVDWGDFGVCSPTIDLAPCLAYDQLERYIAITSEENPQWSPPDEGALASMKLVLALETLGRIACHCSKGTVWAFSHECENAYLESWLRRLEEDLERMS